MGKKQQKKSSKEEKMPAVENKKTEISEKEYTPHNAPVNTQTEDLLSQLPPEARKKVEIMKEKLDKFKKEIVEKFEEYIKGVALMPPQKPQNPAEMKPEDADKVEILVLVDDSDSKKMSKEELKQKLSTIIIDMAKKIDTNIMPNIVLLSEVWQSCYDQKYEILQLIALSAPIYDTGMLAALKISEIHKQMVLKKFEKYIVSYVLAGSLVRGEAKPESDVDVFIVIDDTDVKKMTRAELKDKLRAIIIGMGIDVGQMTGIKNKINIQVYILTDFWDSIREANPVIFTFLRDGVPLYDRGVFMPWKQLLTMGRIKPSMEAIDKYMVGGEQMLKNIRFKIKEIGMEDIFWAITTPSQAALMLYGMPPSTPKETAELMRQIFVKKEGFLEDEYVKILENVIKVRKDLEHGTLKDISGKEVDKMLTDAEKYMKRIDKLFQEITEIKEKETVVFIYERINSIIRDILKMERVESVKEEDLLKVFEKELIAKGKIPTKTLRELAEIIKAKKEFDSGKLTKSQVEKIRNESNSLIKFLVEYMQRARGKELERAMIKFKYGDKYGELTMLGDRVYINPNLDSSEMKLQKAPLHPDGSIGEIEQSTPEEFEQDLAKVQIPPKTFIKAPIFEDLKKLFGRDVEILVRY